MSTPVRVVLSLISHTNIGKTTLARTLLKEDVGEVRDAAHVTAESADYILIQTESDQLVLWDTPGFGNVHQLLKRLEQEGGALGWIMHHIVDRAVNRSLYSSVEAARNVRAESDVVLYLVNVRERPEDAAYVATEMQLLAAFNKPVLMILNQVEHQKFNEINNLKDLEQLWFQQFKGFSCLKEVMTLDAFARSWHQELQLIDKVHGMLTGEKQAALKRLRARFLLMQQHLFDECSRFAADTLWFAAHQRMEQSEDASPKTVFQTMVSRLQAQLDQYLDLLVQRHRIEAEGQARLEADIRQVTGLVSEPMAEKRAGLLAGAVASAGSGLMADMVSGGLTFGGGALLGFLGGYLGGFSYARLLNLRGKQGPVTWDQVALVQLVKLLASYYLLAAIHGRGKGRLMLREPAPFLTETLDQTWPQIEEDTTQLVAMAVRGSGERGDDAYFRSFREVFARITGDVLAVIFPVHSGEGH